MKLVHSQYLTSQIPIDLVNAYFMDVRVATRNK